jgi:acyl-[acyl-carrier-protein]-phospholipid O-acyltransferase/long-chain-fatty-acid--[acyl-carrier-protein] ligase
MTAAFHPSPLQAKEVAHRIKKTGATILLATDTFVSHYARAGKEGDLSSLRYAVCGAERVRDETRRLLRTKYGVELLEGYGATEAAPVIAVNPPSDNRAGTVGTFLAGIEHKLEPVEGITEGGRLLVRGPNVMKGYLHADEPGKIFPPEGGWHDTGDIVTVDEDGYVAIRGRIKRFAKIGGEMVSLTVVENCASSLWPDHNHAAAALAGEGRKGEEIVLLSTNPQAKRSDMSGFIRSHGITELATPRRIFHVQEIPVLGTGKTDYGTVQKLANAAKAEEDAGQQAKAGE